MLQKYTLTKPGEVMRPPKSLGLLHCILASMKYTIVYLKHMEGFKLDATRLLPQQVHHEFEVIWITDVTRHCSEVVSV